MAENSNIEWTDHTFNPWIGCTKVSPGCAHCYAETLMDTRHGRVKWGKGQPRSKTSAENWKKPRQWNAAAVKAGVRPRVLCASLADWLDEEVPAEWLAELLALVFATPQLDWLLLTKRPGNFHNRMKAAISAELKRTGEEPSSFLDWMDGWAIKGDVTPANVWIGTTVENQEWADRRIPELLQIPARVRFLSCEPLLGPVALGVARALPIYREAAEVTMAYNGIPTFKRPGREGYLRHDGNMQPWVNWVIAGGESGAKARPMHPEWVRSLRDQCQASRVPFFFKQWGEWEPCRPEQCYSEGADIGMRRVGKKATGRVLDGREWSEFPNVEGKP